LPDAALLVGIDSPVIAHSSKALSTLARNRFSSEERRHGKALTTLAVALPDIFAHCVRSDRAGQSD